MNYGPLPESFQAEMCSSITVAFAKRTGACGATKLLVREGLVGVRVHVCLVEVVTCSKAIGEKSGAAEKRRNQSTAALNRYDMFRCDSVTTYTIYCTYLHLKFTSIRACASL